MARHRSAREVKANVGLKFFENTPFIPSGDPAWDKIKQWQREGKLRIAWDRSTKDGCRVELTDKGREALKDGTA